MNKKTDSPSFGKQVVPMYNIYTRLMQIFLQVFSCFAIYTLSMSIGAGSGFSGVSIPQVALTWVV
jgi:hypothetical protein